MFANLIQFIRRKSIKGEDKLFFVQHLALMLRAGITLPKAIGIMANQSKKKYFKHVQNDLKSQLEKGGSFEQALSKYKYIFPAAFISMVKIGELKGDLATVLQGYFHMLRKQMQIKSKVRAALIYPAVVVVALGAVGIMAVVVIFPRMVDLVTEVEGELPLVTKIAIGMSNILINYGIYIGIFLAVLAFVYTLVLKTEPGKRTFHYIFLKTPILAPILKLYNLAMFARNFGSLLKSGIAITDCLEATSDTMNNYYYKQSLLDARELVSKGGFIHIALERYRLIYPDVVVQLMVVGEQAGTLDEMLLELADFYEGKVTNTLEALTSIIEPIIILILGSAVAFLALSILMPMYSLTSML